MKKIKKRSKSSGEYQDPELEEVGEERSFEIEEDEETNEIVFVYHYRRKWGDEFDADTEHALNCEEAADMIGIVVTIMERIKDRVMKEHMLEKVVPEVKEGNPLQGPQNLDGK